MRNGKVQFYISAKSTAIAPQLRTVLKRMSMFAEETCEPELADVLLTDDPKATPSTPAVFFIKEGEAAAEHSEAFTVGRSSLTEVAEGLQRAASRVIAKNAPESQVAALCKENKMLKDKLEEYERSLLKSSEIQQEIMSHETSRLSGMELAVKYRPMNQISGDVFFAKEVFDKVFLMVADVTDHGYQAGMYGSTLYALANSFVQRSSLIEQGVDVWAQYMLWAAKAFRSEKPSVLLRNSFAAHATFAVIDRSNQKACFVCQGTGGEPPVILKANGDVQRAKVSPEKTGPPLGDFVEQLGKVITAQFCPGDALLLYSDGLTETFSRSEAKNAADCYSESNLLASLKRIPNREEKSPGEIIELVCSDAEAFSMEPDFSRMRTRDLTMTDDFTLACLKWSAGQQRQEVCE